MASKAKIIRVGAILFSLFYAQGATYAADDVESPEKPEKREVGPLVEAHKEHTGDIQTTEECEECRREHEVPRLSPHECYKIAKREESKWPQALLPSLETDGTIIIQRVLTGEDKGQLRVILTPFDIAKSLVSSLYGQRHIRGMVTHLETILRRVSTDRLNELLSWEERAIVRDLGGEMTTISPIGIFFARLVSDDSGKDQVQVTLSPMDARIFEQLLDQGAQEAVRKNMKVLEESLGGWGKFVMKGMGDWLLWKLRAQRAEALVSSGGEREAAAATSVSSGLHNDSRFYYFEYDIFRSK
jgi:hypothetical protein